MGVWQSEAGSFWMEVWTRWDYFSVDFRKLLQLNACTRMPSKGDDLSHHLHWTLTGNKQGLLLGDNVNQGKSWGSWGYQLQGAGWGPGSGTQNVSDASGHLLSVTQTHKSFFRQHEVQHFWKWIKKKNSEHKVRWYYVVTQQESSMTSGSSSPPTSKTSPLQALNLTEPWAAGRSSADLQTEVFRQWMMMCCTASELSRCRKFNWTRPTLIAGFSNRQNRCWLTATHVCHVNHSLNVIIVFCWCQVAIMSLIPLMPLLVWGKSVHLQ